MVDHNKSDLRGARFRERRSFKVERTIAMGHPANVPQSRQDDDKAHHGPDLQ